MARTVLLVVEGLPRDFTSEGLELLCHPYGNVVFAKVVASALAPAQQLIGFVRMATKEQGEQLVDHLHGRQIKQGYTVSVTLLAQDEK
jgi:hypothetical protein